MQHPRTVFLKRHEPDLTIAKFPFLLIRHPQNLDCITCFRIFQYMMAFSLTCNIMAWMSKVCSQVIARGQFCEKCWFSPLPPFQSRWCQTTTHRLDLVFGKSIPYTAALFLSTNLHQAATSAWKLGRRACWSSGSGCPACVYEEIRGKDQRLSCRTIRATLNRKGFSLMQELMIETTVLGHQCDTNGY